MSQPGLDPKPHNSRAMQIFLLMAAAGVVIQMVVPSAALRGLLAAAINGIAAAAIFYGIRRQQPERPVPWALLGIALALLAINNVGWTFELIDPDSRVGAIVSDVGWGLASVFVLVAIGMFIHHRRVNRRRDAVADGTLIAAAGAVVLWQWYLVVQSGNGFAVLTEGAGAVVLVAMVFAVTATLYRLSGGTANRNTSVWLLIAGAVATFAAQLALAWTSGDGQPARWTDITWLAAAIFVGAAALHPSMAQVTDAPRTRQNVAPRLVIAGAALLANPAIVLLHLSDANPDRTLILVIGGMMALLTLVGLRRVGHLIAELDDAKTELGRSERRYRSLVQRASDLVVVVDAHGALTYVSPASANLLGFTPEELAATPVSALVAQVDQSRFSGYMGRVANADRQDAITIEIGIMNHEGEPRRAEMVAVNLHDDPAVRGTVITIRDVTERAAFQAKLQHLAWHDSLTGLANRDLFRDRVSKALERTADNGRQVAVVFIDLDDFKTINDSLGHIAGDELLRTIAHRLGDCLRSTDTAARLGGDEFAVLLEKMPDPDHAVGIVERIQAALRQPITVDGRSVRIGATIGLALGDHMSTPGHLLRNADTAMFRAKHSGKDRWVIFHPSMHDAARSRFDLMADLHAALERNEFTLHYQPLYSLEDVSIQGFEALIRWNHPERGLVHPDEFVPLLEETGQIIPIGRWVMSEAFAQAGRWQSGRGDDERLTISVNVSVRRFQQPDLVSDVADALHRTRLHPSDVVLEITESAFLGDTAGTIARLNQLRQLGVRLAIDDFGTGYSALGYLQQFRADILKIDKSFVHTIGHQHGDPTLTAGIVGLAEALGMKTVAEGVETQGQMDDLVAMGCDLAQGFLLARPRPAAEIDQLLQTPRGGLRVLETRLDTGT